MKITNTRSPQREIGISGKYIASIFSVANKQRCGNFKPFASEYVFSNVNKPFI
jgi:hypothetical protein